MQAQGIRNLQQIGLLLGKYSIRSCACTLGMHLGLKLQLLAQEIIPEGPCEYRPSRDVIYSIHDPTHDNSRFDPRSGRNAKPGLGYEAIGASVLVSQQLHRSLEFLSKEMDDMDRDLGTPIG